MAMPPSCAALNPARAPDSFPIGVRAPARITEPAMTYPLGCESTFAGSVEPVRRDPRNRPGATGRQVSGAGRRCRPCGGGAGRSCGRRPSTPLGARGPRCRRSSASFPVHAVAAVGEGDHPCRARAAPRGRMAQPPSLTGLDRRRLTVGGAGRQGRGRRWRGRQAAVGGGAVASPIVAERDRWRPVVGEVDDRLRAIVETEGLGGLVTRQPVLAGIGASPSRRRVAASSSADVAAGPLRGGRDDRLGVALRRRPDGGRLVAGPQQLHP